MIDVPQYVSSYRDRHGKIRWRYRKGSVNVQLPDPDAPEFSEAVSKAQIGLRRRSMPARGASHARFVWRPGHTDARKRAMIEHYCIQALRRARNRAKERDLPYDLTAPYFAQLMHEQNFKCAVSGIPFPDGQIRGGAERAFRPSLDRIKPSGGYVIGNVRLVCEAANFAMNNWGEAVLIKLAEAVVANRRGLTDG